MNMYEIKKGRKFYTLSRRFINKNTNYLPPGYYSVSHSDYYDTCSLNKSEINVSDRGIVIPNNCELILKEMQTFWSAKKLYDSYGMLHKRGYLFYGPPGTGKTTMIRIISKIIAKEGGLALRLENVGSSVAIAKIRNIEPERRIVIILEDLETYSGDMYDESELSNVVDGIVGIDNVVYISTTNVIEKLGAKFICRPRRFDRIVKVDYPSQQERKDYFSMKDVDIDEQSIKEMDRFPYAFLAEYIICTQCLSKSKEETMNRLINMRNAHYSMDEFKNQIKVGF